MRRQIPLAMVCVSLFGVVAAAASASAECSADVSYGAASVTNPRVVIDKPAKLFVAGDLNAGVDSLRVEMWNGFAEFVGGIHTGFFSLGANYADCGLCVRLLTESGDDGYLATGGAATITELTPHVVLQLSNVTFRHVVIDPTTLLSSPHPDGCTSNVVSATIDAPRIEVPALGDAGLVLMSGALLAAGIRRLRRATC